MDRRDFIHAGAAGAACAMLGGRALASAGRRPNIVIIMADDLGYGDVDCFGSELIKTPHIDNMADQGIRLTSFYSCAAICAPSRSGVMTGRYPVRNGVTNNFCPHVDPGCVSMELVTGLGLGMDTDEITLGQALSNAGYKTACIGKWHLGDLAKYLPTSRGFDFYFGIPYSNDMEPVKLYQGCEVIEHPVDQDTLTQRYTKEALRFIEDSKDSPFLLYLPHTFPHIPLHASQGFKGRSEGGPYGDCVEEIDWSTGAILSALDRLGLSENTLVIFTSDNGPWYQGSTGGYRGRKNEIMEGGMRVPAIARWPGVISSGQVSDSVAMNIDLFTTALGLAGEPLPDDRPIDGKDIMPLLKGGQSPHQAIFYYWLDNLHAVRSGKWKYHRQHRLWTSSFFFAKKGPMLFDIEADPYESYNLVELYPDKARELEGLMQEWEAELVKGVPG